MLHLARAPGRFEASAFDALSAHVAILDPRGVIVAVNGAWARFEQANGGRDTVGQNYLSVCERVDSDATAREVALAIRAALAGSDAPFETEYPCHAPHEQRYFVVRVTGFEQDGQRYAVVAHENVTRRKLAELKVRELNRTLEARVEDRTRELAVANEELAASNRELAQFAYVASHDLQEPLRMVGSYSDLLARRYGGKLDERADTYLHYITDGVGRMRRLIRDLLSLASVESSPQRAALDLGALFEETLRDVTLEDVSVRRAPLPPVAANEVQLRQLLVNLVGNAVKFRARRPLELELSGALEGRLVHVVLRDNGIGIAPEHAERVFLMFQRLHGRAQFEGNGIGLSICRKIVEQHGGRMWVESREGEGAAFHFTLPAHEDLTPSPV
ncbi:sensor histidine kinase [Deinococcus pimensis]|uniref:sensor histidine kinase n=1 Tax=Deinococcus pimensis TaxID=309888 RepID=UPI000481F036|nr:ATP-binding protein [Deinococcus pimensis]